MALSIASNASALMAASAASSANRDMDVSMERLATGKRVNSASDDAAGVSTISRMNSQVRGLNQAIENAGQGQSMAATAEGAMVEVESMLQRMRELSVQSVNDTLNSNDRSNLNDEVDQLKQEIDRVVSATAFNGTALLDGSGDFDLQLGANAGQTMNFKVGNLSTTALGTSLSGAASTASTSNSASGTAAVETVAQMAFNGNDTYEFDLEVGDGAGGTTTLSIAGADVAGGSASDVADKINTAIGAAVTAGSMAAGSVEAKANGNVISITNNMGDSVSVSGFSSDGNGTASYSSVSGAGSSLLLDDAGATTSLSNTGGGGVTNAAGTLTLEAGKDYNFTVNGNNISVSNLGTDTTEDELLAELKLAIGEGAAGSAVSGQVFTLEDSSGKNIEITNFDAAASEAGSAGSMSMTIRTDSAVATPSNTFAQGGSDTSDIGAGAIVQLQFSESEGDYSLDLGGESFTVATASAGDSLQEAIGATRDAINANTTINGDITARVVDGKLEIENKSLAAVTLDNFGATGKAAEVAGAATFGSTNMVTAQNASTNNGVEATPSETTMRFSDDDTYSFKVGGAQVTAQVSDGNLDNMVAAVNSQSNITGIEASLSNGDLLLTNASGGAINLTDFSSEGTGSATAATAAGQGGSATLTDTNAVTGASTAAAGVATATTMELSMDTTDDVSFQISDGRTNSVVRLTSFDTTDNSAMLAEVQSALSQSGSNITASVTSATSAITLTNSLGGEVELSNFKSDGAGVMTASPASEQGVGKMLDDTGTGASQSAVAAIDISSSSGATSALDALDRAIETIGKERANLGAVMNRLDSTISNLTNVSVNTEAAKGRIEDADFATESTNMTKSKILAQASTSMLAQANASKQGVLSLLQG
ncbi:MAG: flagellin [Planktotalea sp.]|uniref:flagellin N-terminal helical domain-containing protein n=1 Tax=Planktotalea sp. TaxID=2029877 RepID=UPI002601737E|nr:flagellin [Planktotalea sp.]MDG1085139.1 flagellin [Planktotalea sp.]